MRKKQDHYDIYRKLIGPGEPLRLNTGSKGGYSPAWSPDGRLIAYFRHSHARFTHVCVIPALGGPDGVTQVLPDWWYINYPR